MKYLKILITPLLLVLLGFNHPFYASVTEIEYSSKTKEVGISVKVFPDDLEEDLRKFNGKKYDVVQGDKKIIGPILDTYIKQQMRILLNRNLKSYQWMGNEIDKESIWIYFSIINQPGVRSIQVQSDLMYAYKQEQTNIIRIKLDDKRESFRLMAPEKTAMLKK
jgi:23S rRNA A1618 N6-methylase RlmF